MILERLIDLEVIFKTRHKYILSKLDCGIRAADGLVNSFQIDTTTCWLFEKGRVKFPDES
jgi:hypothetical protein